MAGTSGLSSGANGIAGPLLTWLAVGGTAPALTGAIKVAFLSTVRTTNNGTDTEWGTGSGYTQTGGGATGGVAGPTFGAPTTGGPSGSAQVVSTGAVTLNNAPAQSWAGNRMQDSAATNNRELWYAPLTGGTKTVNAGDTCTIPSGSLTLNLG
jgi:hypothetical protein